MSDHNLQFTCAHPKAVETMRTREAETTRFERREFTLVHLHCEKCGMYFCRDEYAENRSAQWSA